MPICKTVFIQALHIYVDYIIGRSAADNNMAIDAAEPHHLWFHVENEPSCHVIAAIPETIDRKDLRYIVSQGAILCKQHCARVRSQKNVQITYTTIGNLEKTSKIGCVRVSAAKTVKV